MKREILTSLFRRSIRCLNLNDISFIKQVDGQIRLKEFKISLCGELELRSRLFREDHARYRQEIEELLRICCEESNRARQARIDELSMHQERNPTTVSQLLAQIRELQKKVNSLSDAREYYDPETANSEQLLSDPRSQSTLEHSESQNRALPRFWIAARYIECYGYCRKRFERLPAREGPPSALFENSRNLASYSQELRPDTAGNTKRHVHFRRRVSVEEQRAQKYDRFLRGRQIAYMICEHCRATGACEAVQGVSDLFTINLQNDDVQDFDVRWNHHQ